MGEMKNAFRVLVRKPGRKTWKTGCRWDDNIKMDLTELQWEGLGQMTLA
jgi:hypothetical protein